MIPFEGPLQSLAWAWEHLGENVKIGLIELDLNRLKHRWRSLDVQVGEEAEVSDRAILPRLILLEKLSKLVQALQFEIDVDKFLAILVFGIARNLASVMIVSAC